MRRPAAAGESVAILYQDQIIALRPIEVEALDYVEAEYQISNQKMSEIDKNLTQQSNQELKLKKPKQFKGNLEELI